jgi:hypothetical protein
MSRTGDLGMNLIQRDLRAPPIKICEFCLQPMKFLGIHASCYLFRCDECALIASRDIEPQQPPTIAPKRSGTR